MHTESTLLASIKQYTTAVSPNATRFTYPELIEARTQAIARIQSNLNAWTSGETVLVRTMTDNIFLSEIIKAANLQERRRERRKQIRHIIASSICVGRELGVAKSELFLCN